MAYPGMHENESKEKMESGDEEYMETLGACPSDMISECCGTSTVKDFPTANPENVLRANAALKQQRGR